MAAALLLVPLVVEPAAAAQATTAQPDSVTPVAQPGIALHLPADGRINGDGYSGEITGYRFANRVGYGPTATRPPKGQRLLVFGLQDLPLLPVTDYAGAVTTPAVTPLLVVDGAQQPLPTPTDSAAGPTYFLASISAGAADVSLQVSSQGFTQTFSFTQGTRVGPQPDVLYRQKSSWQATDPVRQTITLSTPDPNENAADAALDVTLSEADITWFGPGGARDNPPTTDQAWLVLDATSSPKQIQPVPVALDYLSTLAPSQVTLTLPGSPTPLPAKLAGQGGPSDQSAKHAGIFGGIYYWQVPASLTSATVTIAPDTIRAENAWLGAPQTIQVRDTAVFPLSFPDPYTPAPPPPSPPPDATALATSAWPAAAHTGGGFPAVPLGGALLLLLLLLAAAGLIVQKRRGTLAPSARTIPAATHLGPSSASAIALPPAPVSVPSTDADPAHPPSDSDSAQSVPTIPLDEPAPHDQGIRVTIFGRPAVVGSPGPLNQTELEILAMLALHPGESFTTEQIRSRLGRGRDKELGTGTIHRYLGNLRHVLGPERVPKSRARGRYSAHGVSTDAGDFHSAVSAARQTASPSERLQFLESALRQVKGAPFAEAPSGTFGWAYVESDLAATLSNAIVTTALELATLALEHGDAELATWSVDRGLIVSATEESLHMAYLTAAAKAQPVRLEQARTEVRTRLKTQREQPSERLEEHYRRLRDELS